MPWKHGTIQMEDGSIYSGEFDIDDSGKMEESFKPGSSITNPENLGSNTKNEANTDNAIKNETSPDSKAQKSGQNFAGPAGSGYTAP